MMKLSTELPPNYEQIKAKLPHVAQAGERRMAFTYGDTIYNVPDENMQLPLHFMMHETVHSHQQGDDPAGWWEKYLDDATFRADQEAEAYGTQYAYVVKHMPNRYQKTILEQLAKDLSSPVYGNIFDRHQAATRIRLVAKRVLPAI